VVKSNHSLVGYVQLTDAVYTHKGHHDVKKVRNVRDRVFRQIWSQIDDSTMCIIVTPCEHEAHPHLRGVTRDEQMTFITIKGVGDGQKSRVTCLTSMATPGTTVSKQARRNVVSLLKMNWKNQEYHQNITPLHDIDMFVGYGLGKSFSLRCEYERTTGQKNLEERVDAVLKANESMQEFAELFPWFPHMMKAVLANKLTPVATVSLVSMHDVSTKEGKDIGALLGMSIACCQMSHAAVDDWIHKARALQDIDNDFFWFRPMMDAISFQLLMEASWGMRLRVFFGAGISLFDVASDLYMIYVFYQDGGFQLRNFKFWFQLSTVLLSISLQLLLVHVQRRKNHIREKMYVIFCVKPMVDAYRIVTGQDRGACEDGAVMSTLFEAILCKAIEIVIENIPGGIMQTFAFVNGDIAAGARTAALASIFMTCMSTGYITTTLSYDGDIDPVLRKGSPEFFVSARYAPVLSFRFFPLSPL